MTSRSVAQVVEDVFSNIQEIVRSEVRLVKAEIKEEAGRGLAAVAVAGTGLLLAFYAVGLVLVSLLLALMMLMPAWMAAITLAVPTSIMAILFIRAGIKRLRTLSVIPEKTIESVKENVQWLRQPTT